MRKVKLMLGRADICLIGQGERKGTPFRGKAISCGQMMRNSMMAE